MSRPDRSTVLDAVEYLLGVLASASDTVLTDAYQALVLNASPAVTSALQLGPLQFLIAAVAAEGVRRLHLDTHPGEP